MPTCAYSEEYGTIEELYFEMSVLVCIPDIATGLTMVHISITACPLAGLDIGACPVAPGK